MLHQAELDSKLPSGLLILIFCGSQVILKFCDLWAIRLAEQYAVQFMFWAAVETCRLPSLQRGAIQMTSGEQTTQGTQSSRLAFGIGHAGLKHWQTRGADGFGILIYILVRRHHTQYAYNLCK